MYHKGITREQVIETAVTLVEENGLENFSMHQLASALEIRAASLYKHVSGMEDVILSVFLRATTLQTQVLTDAIFEKQGDEAVIAFAEAYRSFARQHPGLYHIILDNWDPGNDIIAENASKNEVPYARVLADFSLSREEWVHWLRILRSIMHGFITYEETGFFTYFKEDKEETYRLAIQCFLDGLHHRNHTQ